MFWPFTTSHVSVLLSSIVAYYDFQINPADQKMQP